MGTLGISINTIADAAVSDTFKSKRGFYLNIAHVFFGLGSLTSPILFNLVYSRTEDFRSIYFILFLMTVVVFFVMVITKYPSVNNEKIKPAVILELLKEKRFLYLCIYALLSAGSMHSISGWIPTLFSKNLNISTEISNYSLSFFWISIVAGRIIIAFLSKKFSEGFLIKILNIML